MKLKFEVEKGVDMYDSFGNQITKAPFGIVTNKQKIQSQIVANSKYNTIEEKRKREIYESQIRQNNR